MTMLIKDDLFSICDSIPAGVVSGKHLRNLLVHARENGYAIPAFVCKRYVHRKPFIFKSKTTINVSDLL